MVLYTGLLSSVKLLLMFNFYGLINVNKKIKFWSFCRVEKKKLVISKSSRKMQCNPTIVFRFLTFNPSNTIIAKIDDITDFCNKAKISYWKPENVGSCACFRHVGGASAQNRSRLFCTSSITFSPAAKRG